MEIEVLSKITKKRGIYLLSHCYEYGANKEHEETKHLGVYTSVKKAKEAIEFYRKLPGFSKYPKKCFIIEGFNLDQNMWWVEGFVSM